MIVTQKLKEIVRSVGSSPLCPKNFFTLNIPTIKISYEQRQQIFQLMTLNRIAQTLVEHDRDSLKSDCNIIQIINKDEIVKKLDHEVISLSNYRCKVITILAKVDQLKRLPKYLKNKRVSNYGALLELVQEMIHNQIK